MAADQTQTAPNTTARLRVDANNPGPMLSANTAIGNCTAGQKPANGSSDEIALTMPANKSTASEAISQPGRSGLIEEVNATLYGFQKLCKV